MSHGYRIIILNIHSLVSVNETGKDLRLKVSELFNSILKIKIT